jgi:nitroreductase
MVIPCIEGRVEGRASVNVAGLYGSIIPAAWSFMLAARSRGLGSVWTTFHLDHERLAAEILELPYDEVTQVALIPVAYTLGQDFKPGVRKPLDTMVHWDHW